MLFADATVLIALGELGWIPLLQQFDPEITISATVRSEVIRSARQLTEAIDQSWLRVETAKAEELTAFRTLAPALDRGEAETIVILRATRPESAKVLVDERAAFNFLIRLIDQVEQGSRIEVICLAQVLHGLEDRRVLPVTAEAASIPCLPLVTMRGQGTSVHFIWTGVGKRARIPFLADRLPSMAPRYAPCVLPEISEQWARSPEVRDGDGERRWHAL